MWRPKTIVLHCDCTVSKDIMWHINTLMTVRFTAAAAAAAADAAVWLPGRSLT